MEKMKDKFFSVVGEALVEVEKISGSGSNRRYERWKSVSRSLIFVEGESVEENETFLYLSGHFAQKGLPVPQILAVSDDRRMYLQEDFGGVSLFDYIKNGRETGIFSEQEKAMVEKTIRLLPRVQFEGADGLDFEKCYQQKEFNERTILWDLNYFKYYFLKPSGVYFSEELLENEYCRIVEELLQDKTCTFLYRDFQSRNVMIANGEPCLIDYQGGRKGPIYYDVASFLWQAKANFSDEFREQMLDCYFEELQKFLKIGRTYFNEKLQKFVLFRLMQVLGAYGYRGYFERKKHFLESIPFALKSLKKELVKSADCYLKTILLEMCEKLLAEKTEVVYNKEKKLVVEVYSFSYKKGIPEDASGNGGGYVFDCRWIHNPGKYEQYKLKTGLDESVIKFLEDDGEILTFLKSVYALADDHVKRYIERGFEHLMFSFGCTGGQHRSVYSAQHVAEYISEKYGVEVHLCHREQGITKIFEKNESVDICSRTRLAIETTH